MTEDREQLLSVAQEVVSAGLRTSSNEDRMSAAFLSIRERVVPTRMEEFWVALIEHATNTMSPFLAVYGDELTTDRTLAPQSPELDTDLPLRLVNDALGHASAGDYAAVADVVRLIATLDEHQRAIALGNVVHIALVIGELVRGRCGTSEPESG